MVSTIVARYGCSIFIRFNVQRQHIETGFHLGTLFSSWNNSAIIIHLYAYAYLIDLSTKSHQISIEIGARKSESQVGNFWLSSKIWTDFRFESGEQGTARWAWPNRIPVWTIPTKTKICCDFLVLVGL